MSDASKQETSYYLQDEMGSPVRLSNQDGDLIQGYGYDEFGRELYENRIRLQPFGFTGYQYDDMAESYFAQAREYDCNNGRFNSVDPYKGTIYKSDTINSYIYCVNNPLLYFDPLGLAPAWLDGIWAHLQIEYELHYRQFPCANTQSNVRIPGAGLGPTGVGIADFLVDKGTHVEIYEIKPESWSSGYLNKLAFAQLDRYVKGYNKMTNVRTIRGTQVFGDSLPYYKDPTRTLTYWSDGSGLIYYKISPKPGSQELPAVIPEPKTEFDKEKVVKPILIGTCILACLYTVGTIIEDVVTGGTGIADDALIPVIWKWALSF